MHATHGVGEEKLHEKATASVESANVGVEAVAKLEQIGWGALALWVHRVELRRCKYGETLDIINVSLFLGGALAPIDLYIPSPLSGGDGAVHGHEVRHHRRVHGWPLISLYHLCARLVISL